MSPLVSTFKDLPLASESGAWLLLHWRKWSVLSQLPLDEQVLSGFLNCYLSRSNLRSYIVVYLCACDRHWRVAACPPHPTPQAWREEFWTCCPKIRCLGILRILSGRPLNTSKCGFSLNASCLPQNTSSKGSPTVGNSHPGSFINQQRLTLVTGEETRSRHHTQTLLQTVLSPISSKGLFIVPKNHFLSPKRPPALVPFF